VTEAEVQTHSAASTANEHTRWNFVVMIVEAVFSSAGLAWTDPGTVLPVFIGLLGGSTVLVGLVPVLMQIGWILPQLPIAALVGHVPERRPYLRWGVTIGRLPFLAFVAYLWVAGTTNPAAVLLFLLLGYFAMALGNGFIAVPWQDLVAKSIPSGLRGRFFGLMQFSCAVMAIGVGFVVRWALGPSGAHFPTNYEILFTLTALFWTISIIMWWVVREPIRPVLDRPESVREIVAGILPLLRRQRAVRSLVAIEMLGIGLCLAAPFYMVYATRELHIAPQMAGVYIWAATLGNAISSLLWAHLNDRRGPRGALRGGAMFVVLAPALAVLVPLIVGRTPVLPYAYALVFLISGSSQNGLWMGINTYLFDLASHEERHRYVAILSTLAAPGALLPLVVGVLLRFLPYPAVFLLMAAGGAVVWATAWRMPLPTVLPAGSVISGPARDEGSREQEDEPS
jgi:MFS family permease